MTVLSNLANYLLSLPVLFAFFLFFGVNLTAWALLLPVLILVQFVFMTGLALALSSLNVYLKDIEQVMGTS